MKTHFFQDSDEFRTLGEVLANDIESLYANIPGEKVN